MEISEHYKKELIRKYTKLQRLSRNRADADGRKLIRRAYELAYDAHSDMYRKSGEPYIFHPLEVALIVAEEIGLGATSIACALLHDVVEDTEYTIEDIENLFGKKIAIIIDGLTKISGIVEKSGTSSQLENFKRILLTISDDVRVILVKLADRLHNMRTLDAMSDVKQLKIASETAFLFAPLAHRLGLYSIKSEMEDLALKYTEPSVHDTLAVQLTETEDERTKFINRFIGPIRRDLNKLGIKYTIESRVKSKFSIWRKMKDKNISLDQVYDLFAVRIVVDSPYIEENPFENEKVDCWKVYTSITARYKPKMDRLRDWLSIPKVNGYEALHTTVMSNDGKWVEIQIRSKRMNDIAEKGFAAHWKYKKAMQAEDSLESWLSKIQEWLRSPEAHAAEFIDDFKLNLYEHEITVFTPKGKVIKMPRGATALDFAYTIHTDIGNSCIGSKVNQKLTPVNQVLHNGDQVQIITSKKQQPKEEWLQYAVTARARAAIKSKLKEEYKRLKPIGDEKLSNFFNTCRIPYSQQNIKSFKDYVKIGSTSKLFYLIAIGEINLKSVKDYAQTTNLQTGIFNRLARPFTKRSSSKTVSKSIREQLKENPETLILGEKIDKLDYQLSDCCNPIPGDDIIGFLSHYDEIIIHRINCSKTIDFMSKYGDRVIKAKWNEDSPLSFLAGILIEGSDRLGLINEITTLISQDLNVNIRSFNIESSEGHFKGSTTLYVYDTAHLENLIKRLKSIQGILVVKRLDHSI